MESIGSFEDINSIKEWDKNPRNNEEAIAKVARSIKRFGFASPIIVRKEDRTIIAGHTRYLAAQSLGLKTIPVRFMDLDPTEAELLAIADNKIGEIADWNDQMLAELLNSYNEEDIEILGFNENEIEDILAYNDESFFNLDIEDMQDDSILDKTQERENITIYKIEIDDSNQDLFEIKSNLDEIIKKYGLIVEVQ